MSFPDLNWGDLLMGVVGAIIGWLSNIFRPAPGTTKTKR